MQPTKGLRFLLSRELIVEPGLSGTKTLMTTFLATGAWTIRLYQPTR